VHPLCEQQNEMRPEKSGPTHGSWRGVTALSSDCDSAGSCDCPPWRRHGHRSRGGKGEMWTGVARFPSTAAGPTGNLLQFRFGQFYRINEDVVHFILRSFSYKRRPRTRCAFWSSLGTVLERSGWMQRNETFCTMEQRIISVVRLRSFYVRQILVGPSDFGCAGLIGSTNVCGKMR
jgi:hypothetical protein